MTDEHDHIHGQRDPEGYSLVMPFVVTKTQGGPYEDDAYVAGWEAGAIDAWLSGMHIFPGVTFQLPKAIHTDNTPQLDLIAMKHGLAATFTDAGDCWSWMTLSKGAG